MPDEVHIITAFIFFDSKKLLNSFDEVEDSLRVYKSYLFSKFLECCEAIEPEPRITIELDIIDRLQGIGG